MDRESQVDRLIHIERWVLFRIQVAKQINIHKLRQTEKWRGRQVDRKVNKQMNGCSDGQMERQLGG